MTTEVEANKRPIEEVTNESVIEVPAEKKQKASCNLDALKKQVEYYMSDANLKHDKFFHTKISENAEGWLALVHILACNKTKALTTSSSDIVESLKMSSEVEVNEAQDSIRRKSPLPAFEGEVRKTLKSAKDKNPAVFKKQVTIGDFKFPNLTAAKKRVGEILKSRRSGVIFKEGTPDYNLVIAVLKEHPNAAAKMEGMTGLKVDVAPQGESRCFFIVKGEAKDSFEDISIVKAFASIEEKLIAASEEKKEVESTPVESTTPAPVSE
jgi:hypothetical protein